MTTWLDGGCHCGAVRVRVRADLGRVLDCNCSVCTKKGYLHMIVQAADFELVRGEDDLTLYQFNTKTAKHYFCKHCGISPYYVPRSHPDGFDVNARCLDDIDPRGLKVVPFEGRQWEDHIHEIEGY